MLYTEEADPFNLLVFMHLLGLCGDVGWHLVGQEKLFIYSVYPRKKETNYARFSKTSPAQAP